MDLLELDLTLRMMWAYFHATVTYLANDITLLSNEYSATSEAPLTPVEIILLRVKRRQAYVTKYNLEACLIVIGHRLDTDELYNICHPNMYMKHGL